MSNKMLTIICLAAAIVLASAVNGRAGEGNSDRPDRTLRERTVNLDLGDAGGHSQIFYNQIKSKQPVDTALARESIDGMSEALVSARKDFELLEKDAMAGADQAKIKIYKKIREHYDHAARNLDALKAEFAKPAADNDRMMSLTKIIFSDLKYARNELNKLGKKPLAEPTMD